MAYLENPPENPCFGCGPASVRGLHLNFESTTSKEGQPAVACTYVPREDEIGWPGLLHMGLHYFVLSEASYWAALILGGRVHRFGGHGVFDQIRLPRVGRSCRVEARISSRQGAELTVLATTSNEKGAPCGTLTSNWLPVSRADVIRSGLDVPGYLLEDMDP